MPPPNRKPFFFDALSGAERTHPENAADVAWLVTRIAMTARTFPDWILESAAGPVAVTLAVPDERPGTTRIGFTAGPVEGVVAAAADPSGWVLVTVEVAGREVLRAYADTPYEQTELWPEGADDAQDADPPGRAGKHLAWVGLSAAAWPAIAPVAVDGHVHLEVAER